ncbi:MAG: FctA domain-containing protein [Raoultibacter sp.]
MSVRKKLCCFMSVFLAMSLMMTGGASFALALPVKSPVATSAENVIPQGDAALVVDREGVVEDSAVVSGDAHVTEGQEDRPESIKAPSEKDDVGVISPAGSIQATPLAEKTQAVPETTESNRTDVSAYFHSTIMTETDSIANNQYIGFNVKYVIDRGNISEGDYIDVTVPNALKDVSLAVSSQIFSSKKDLGGGHYKLTFKENATNGIAGSFSISAFGNNNTDTSTTATVVVGEASKTITVGAGIYDDPIGPEHRGIIKWGYGGDGYAQDGAFSGVFDQEKDVVVTYAIEVDPRMTVMKDVVVTDVICDPMVLDPSSITIIPQSVGQPSGLALSASEVAQIVSVSGSSVTFNFGSRLDSTKFYRIYYDVSIPKFTKGKIENSATIHYSSPGGPGVETSTFTIKPKLGYSNSVGYKTVDKTVISDDAGDQTVTYTITFENDQAFNVGEINLTDRLDNRVRYVDSYGSDYFSLRYDDASHSVAIANTAAIPASSRQSVTIVTDFTDVPIGATIENSVGGNVTKTKKIAGLYAPVAKKTVDGLAPGDKVFSFELLDAAGNVFQVKRNAADGSIVFDPIKYGREDIGVAHTYAVREAQKQSIIGCTFDDSVYSVTLTPTDSNGDGVLECVPVISKRKAIVDSMAFDNRLIAVPSTTDVGGNSDKTDPVVGETKSGTDPVAFDAGAKTADATMDAPATTPVAPAPMAAPETGLLPQTSDDSTGLSVGIFLLLAASVVCGFAAVVGRLSRQKQR